MKNQLILPCVRAIMGDWIVYISAMSGEELSKRVMTDKKYRENPNLDYVLQRDLKDRKKNISKYLLTDEHRFFNSVIIGVFGGPPQWHQFALNKKITELEGKEDKSYAHVVGFLEFNGTEEMFAVDGQHRVAGIQIAYEEVKNKPEEERVLKDDQFPVIFIAHIDDDLGKKRTRKLFSDINNNAKPVSQGDRVVIDEENLSAIVTRRLYAKYKYFNKGKLISLTESEKLEKADVNHFTNLLGIDKANKVIKKLYKKIPKTHEWDEENVKAFYPMVEAFYDYVIKNVMDYNDFFVHQKFTIKKARENNSYLLFRPVGLKLLARLYVHYYKNGELKELKQKINKISFIMPQSPFKDLLWSNGKMQAREKNQVLAVEIALYMLGDLPKQKEPIILERYRELLKDEKRVLPKKLV